MGEGVTEKGLQEDRWWKVAYAITPSSSLTNIVKEIVDPFPIEAYIFFKVSIIQNLWINIILTRIFSVRLFRD